MAKGWRWLLGIVLVAVVVGAVVWYTPTSEYVILPGITANLNQIVKVQGGKPTAKGRLLMVAVDLQQANVLYYLVGRYTPYGELVPASELLGPGVSEQQYEEENQALMSQSHEMAKVAALQALGYPAHETGKGVLVYGTEQGTPAAGKLQPNDVVTAVDGTPLHLDQDLLNYMGHVTPGQDLTLTVLRHGQDQNVKIGTVKSTTEKNHAMIGALIGTYKVGYVIPKQISISTGSISGPSAGMMFSLEIINQLDPKLDLAHGMTVAGTGTIDAFGNVGAIGGVKEKVETVFDSGAKVFLVPRGDYSDAVSEAKAIGITGKMRIIPVGTLKQALSALKSL